MVRILIVDDNAFILKIQQAIVEKSGAEVTAVNSGDTAISMLKNQSFDLVLMDMQMPEKDGVTTTAEIRRFNQSLPIYALTGNDGQAEYDECINAGMNGVLVKPLKFAELNEVLAALG